MKKTIMILVAVVALAVPAAHAQKWAVGTNLVDWAYFGTINVEGQYAIAQHLSLDAQVRYNPWTFGECGNQKQDKRQTYAAGINIWPWHIYSGWWFSLKGQYEEYNRGGIWSEDSEEGDAFGLAVSAGYQLMLHKNLNINLGLGGWAGQSIYTSYTCPCCGKQTGSGQKFFALPNEAIVALVWVF